MRRHCATLDVVACLLISALLGCTATQPAASADNIVNAVLLGFWHGFISPISFIISIFSDHVRMYAFPNAGRWYDLGFMLGIGGLSGGAFSGARKRQAG